MDLKKRIQVWQKMREAGACPSCYWDGGGDEGKPGMLHQLCGRVCGVEKINVFLQHHITGIVFKVYM